ncbi:MAG TPA: prolyl oligopeptidase family serine peptidase [Acidimicrobiales bacterium]|nr:prolyl oligopeptidase family serine peptidase [Acidimicrobiales bacterium]
MRRTRISYGPHRSQVGDLWVPADVAGDLPIVVLIHGGFWRAQYTRALMTRMARAVVQKGWAAWNIEYRRIGFLGGDGGWPQTFEDVAAAVDHVASFPGIDVDRVVTCGHSAGGTLALWAAGRHRLPDDAPGSSVTVAVRGALSLSGISDLAAALASGVGGDAVGRLLLTGRCSTPERLCKASPVALLPLGVPQTLFHGLRDTVVPPSMSERYVARARETGDDALYVPLPGIGHREMIDPRGTVWDAVAAHLGAVLVD